MIDAELHSSLLDYLLDAVQKLDAAVDISKAATFMSAYNFYQKRPSKKSGTTTMLKSASGNLITWMQQMMAMQKCKKILIKESLIYILEFFPSKWVKFYCYSCNCNCTLKTVK